ncbi:GntR family transcriptional regulator [Oscillatoria sp. FACHB-1407]|uniref:GntR family transcriptional regulator n=1 Tax=Oscillatoria sp. FACHB-1407 TaxID=2692847 RepID=UPI00168895C9|nr:GntR family transcriptional regulator [Oscillatoria sp. FACHB-1407]MBD2464217.1 GntR family transcriptional regulator [Oscillatoria sp. FACHB-1407]
MNLNDLAADVLQHQRSTPELIANALRQAITLGIFEEGQSLRQDEIASKFGVSRIPVREALRQLEVEGLVTFHPNRGATVTTLSPTEVQEIFEIRVALETTALRLAIPHLQEADLQQADAILAATDEASDVARWADLNWQFHETLYAPARRPRLMTLIKTLHINGDRYVRLQLAHNNYLEFSQKEHYQLLAACRQQNPDEAIAILQHHITTGGDRLVTYLQNNTR